ncbi:MAG: hypothetical protein ABJC87_10505 [Roseobacter sp.]
MAAGGGFLAATAATATVVVTSAGVAIAITNISDNNAAGIEENLIVAGEKAAELLGFEFSNDPQEFIENFLAAHPNHDILTKENIVNIAKLLQSVERYPSLGRPVHSETLGTDQCFLADTSIRMWPRDPSIKPRLDGSYDEELVLSKVWHKPISEIAVGDIIVAYDKQGRLQPDRVTRTMQNNATHILDFWGTGVTPGHACYCADGPFKGEHAPIMDILRTDTAMMRTDGTMFRATTNCEVGSIGDRMIHAEASVQKPDGSWRFCRKVWAVG